MIPYSIIRTKAGRDKVVSAIADTAASIGADCEHESIGSREVDVEVRRGPYRAVMWFDAAEPVGAFLIHWNVTLDSEATYPKDFPASLNTCHYRKATSQASTLEGLLLALETGFSTLFPSN